MASSPPPVPRVQLGSQGLEVSKQGLGCMGMSAAYGTPKPEEEMIALIHRAVELGVTFLDTSDVYGPHTNEVLVGKAVRGLDRSRVQIATKFGISFGPEGFGSFRIRGDASYVRQACQASLERLGVDSIDLYYQHRVDQTVPIEVTVSEMKKLVEEGKVKHLGLSEASAETIRRAHAVHPITAVQLEWSLWTRGAEEEVIPTCRELGIGIVPYSPLGRGFFGGKGIVEKITDEKDWRRMNERFTGDNLERNALFYHRLTELAQPKHSTAAQLALAWVQAQGDDVVPIPGTTRIPNLEANIGALGIPLSNEDLEAIAAAVPASEVAGSRYTGGFAKYSYEFANTPQLEGWVPPSTAQS